MNASDFITPSNRKTYSLLEYDNDKKMANVNAELLKIRDKYGVDIVRYGSEKMNVV
jgi:DNA polymerase-4